MTSPTDPSASLFQHIPPCHQYILKVLFRKIGGDEREVTHLNPSLTTQSSGADHQITPSLLALKCVRRQRSRTALRASHVRVAPCAFSINAFLYLVNSRSSVEATDPRPDRQFRIPNPWTQAGQTQAIGTFALLIISFSASTSIVSE